MLARYLLPRLPSSFSSKYLPCLFMSSSIIASSSSTTIIRRSSTRIATAASISATASVSSSAFATKITRTKISTNEAMSSEGKARKSRSKKIAMVAPASSDDIDMLASLPFKSTPPLPIDTSLTPASSVGHTLLLAVRSRLSSLGDTSKSPSLQIYTKSVMPFHGVTNIACTASLACKAVWKEVFEEAHKEEIAKLKTSQQWRDTIRFMWDRATHREERYAALYLARHYNPFLRDLDNLTLLYKHLIESVGGWDLCDDIAPYHLSPIFIAHPEQTKLELRKWCVSSSMWLRRCSILAQLECKGSQLDLPFLFHCIQPSMTSKEFFLRRAIGWALRQVVRERPGEIVKFIEENEERMSKIATEQALKYLGGTLEEAKKIMKAGGPVKKSRKKNAADLAAGNKKSTSWGRKRKTVESEEEEEEIEESGDEEEEEEEVASTKPSKRRKA